MDQNLSKTDTDLFLDYDTYYLNHFNDIRISGGFLSDDNTFLDYVVVKGKEEEYNDNDGAESKDQELEFKSPKVTKTPVARCSSISKRLFPWSKKEDDKLRKIVSNFGSKNWDQIALQLGTGRDRNQCRSRYHQYLKKDQNNKICSPWTSSDDNKLLELVKQHGTDWKIISSKMDKKDRSQCCSRYHYLIPKDNHSPRRRWTTDEDSQLMELVNKNGSLNWSLISNQMNTSRTSIQCCNRYNGYLKIRPVSNQISTQTQPSTTKITVSTLSNNNCYYSSTNIYDFLTTNATLEEQYENERIHLLKSIQSQVYSFNALTSYNLFNPDSHIPNKISVIESNAL